MINVIFNVFENITFPNMDIRPISNQTKYYEQLLRQLNETHKDKEYTIRTNSEIVFRLLQCLIAEQVINPSTICITIIDYTYSKPVELGVSLDELGHLSDQCPKVFREFFSLANKLSFRHLEAITARH